MPANNYMNLMVFHILQLSFETGFASMLTQARDGFFLNLGNVLLKLCEPFLDLSDKSKKCLRINSLYCLVDADISDIARPNAPVHLVQNQEEPKIANRTDDSMSMFSHFHF